MLAALALSLTDFDIYALADLRNLRFVGLANYVQLLQTPLFWKALGNTLYFVVVGVPLSIARLARRRAAARIRSWPGSRRSSARRSSRRSSPRWSRSPSSGAICSTRATACSTTAWRDSASRPIDWLGDPHWAMPAIILFAVWKNFGYNMIIFLAGLQSIPRAALRGGAHRRRVGAGSSSATSRCRCSRRSSLLVSILTIAGYFQLFAEPYVMTQGGPLQSTVSVLYFMYEEGFKWWNLGSASAVAFLLFLLDLRASPRCSCA